jgi:Cu/Ag efflux protein CusF
MRALFATLTAIAVLGALVIAPAVMAQTQAPAAAAKTIEGKVMTVDPTGKSLTLDDGTKLTIPESAKFSRADLKPGAAVKAAYEERDGQKILTNLEVTK